MGACIAHRAKCFEGEMSCLSGLHRGLRRRRQVPEPWALDIGDGSCPVNQAAVAKISKPATIRNFARSIKINSAIASGAPRSNDRNGLHATSTTGGGYSPNREKPTSPGLEGMPRSRLTPGRGSPLLQVGTSGVPATLSDFGVRSKQVTWLCSSVLGGSLSMGDGGR